MYSSSLSPCNTTGKQRVSPHFTDDKTEADTVGSAPRPKPLKPMILITVIPMPYCPILKLFVYVCLSSGLGALTALSLKWDLLWIPESQGWIGLPHLKLEFPTRSSANKCLHAPA